MKKKTKQSAKKKQVKKTQAKKPVAKKAPARAKAAKPAKASGGAGTYTPQPVTGIGWAPFRYPLS
jgi:hypothetical protein